MSRPTPRGPWEAHSSSGEHSTHHTYAPALAVAKTLSGGFVWYQSQSGNCKLGTVVWPLPALDES
jgi:hypothetical protein